MSRLNPKQALRFYSIWSNYFAMTDVCAYCLNNTNRSSREANAQNDPDISTIDHIVPLIKGGSDKWTNLVLSCNRCNSDKKEEIWKPFFRISCFRSRFYVRPTLFGLTLLYNNQKKFKKWLRLILGRKNE
jgi:GTPase SAR1 family protein